MSPSKYLYTPILVLMHYPLHFHFINFRLLFTNTRTYFNLPNTWCRRNSALLISKNNILLKVININFSMLQVTSVFHCFCIVALFSVQYRGAHELRTWAKLLEVFQVTMQDALYTAVRHAYHFSVLMCRLPWTAANGCQHSGNVLRCAKWGRPTKLIFTWHSLLQATALPIDRLHLDMGLPVDSVHAKIRNESL